MERIDPSEILLRPTVISDLDTLFIFQLDPEANYLAGFTSKDPSDKAAYIQKFTALLQNPDVHNQTIFYQNKIAGSIAKYVMEGEAEITYWMDKSLWGKGLATAALQHFLLLETSRPLFGRAAFDNTRSQKVMEKAGFSKIGTDKGFANARQAEIEEYIYRLS